MAQIPAKPLIICHLREMPPQTRSSKSTQINSRLAGWFHPQPAPQNPGPRCDSRFLRGLHLPRLPPATQSHSHSPRQTVARLMSGVMEPYSSQYLTSGHGSARAAAEVHRSQSALPAANVSFMEYRLSNYAARLDAHPRTACPHLLKLGRMTRPRNLCVFCFSITYKTGQPAPHHPPALPSLSACLDGLICIHQ